MKFTRSRYPAIPGREELDSPCWTVKGRWLYFDADWNTRWPFGTSLCLRIGPQRPWPDPGSSHKQPKRGLTLDLNAPLGEPNRLYLWGGRRQWMIGLISWHKLRETGREDGVPVLSEFRCRPHLVRGQAWDWKRSEGSTPPRWHWIVIHPNDYRERWACAHPEEAAALERRQAARKAAGGRSDGGT